MKKLTAKEILQIIEDNDISVREFAECAFSPPDDFKYSPEIQQKIDDYNLAKANYENHPDYKQFKYSSNQPKELSELKEIFNKTEYPYDDTIKEWWDSLGLGEWEEVEQFGGEGQGDTWYSVKHFKDHDVYIRTNGYYQSHYGTEFEEGYGYEVRPKEKLIVVYE